MPRRALAILMVLGFIACLSHASAADRYWISSTAKNWSDSSAWSATSGGAGGASVPESGDTAFFDAAGTGNCTISASVSVDRIQVFSGYTGVVALGSNVAVMAGAVVVDGSLRMGTNSKLQLMDSETPLSGTGTLDTATNSPNTIEYRGGGDVEVASTTPVSSYSNLTLTPPGGISRSAVFLGNANEQYFDMAAVDSANGFLYIGSKNAPAKIVKIRLSDYTRVGTLTLASGENDLSPSVVVDSANGFLYAGTRTTPAKVVKIRLSDFTEVGAITLNTGENQLWSATLDSTTGYAYFGTRTSPARIIKIRLSDFTRESAITLASGENEALGAVIDEAAGFAYFGLQTTPAKVVKVRLSDFTAVATLTCNSGEDMVRVGVIDVAAGFAYFGLKTSPGKIVRVKLSDFTRDAVLTMNTGENKLYSGVIDPAGGFAYFGAYTNPGTVIKVKLDDFTRADAVTFGAGEKELDTAAIDASSGFAYFMTDNWTGKAVKVNLNYVGAEWTHPSVLDVNGNLSIGAGTLTSAGQGISLAGNWSNAGTFNPGLSTVTLDGGSQAVNGNNTFRNLTKTGTSAATLTFESGKAQQIAGTLNLQGVSGNLLSLRASSTGQSWRLVAENYQATRFADIKDTDASEGRSLIALSSTDSGSNQNVLFSSPAQVAITTPATSATSPAWVEGNNSGDVSAVTVTVDSGTPFNAVRLSPTKWFADNASANGASLGVTLTASTVTHVEISASNLFGNVNSAAQNITWTATDLNGLSYSSDIVRIRKGDSLLLTATGTGTALEIDGHGDGTFEHSGTPNQKFPTLYSATGTFIARAKIDGVEVGSMAVVVIGVDLHGPIACEVGFQREKDVDVSPASETANVSFVANDGFWVTTSVKQTIATGATLFIKALRRGTPMVEARIGGMNGAILARQEIDEFTHEMSALLSAVFDDETNSGTALLTMRPYVPGMRWQFDMFASTATFTGGQTSLSINTSDLSFREIYDPVSGETVGEFDLDIELPDGEDKYCFNLQPRQSGSADVPVGAMGAINGHGCKVTVSQIFLCAGDTIAKNLTVNVTTQVDDPPFYYRIRILESAGINTEAYFPEGSGPGKTKSKVKVRCDEPGPFEEPTLPGTSPKTYSVIIDQTRFIDRIVVTELNSVTQQPAPDGTSSDRTTIGVGEVVEVSTNPPTNVTWSVSGGGSVTPNAGTTTEFTAGETGSTSTVVATFPDGSSCDLSLTVIPPNGAALTKTADHAYTAGNAGSGFTADVVIQPTNVSFGNIQVQEQTAVAVTTGYYSLIWAGIVHPQGGWIQVDDANGGFSDTVGTVPPGLAPPPAFAAGTFTWPIPWHYRLTGSPNSILFTTLNHVQTMSGATGTETTSKGGATRTRTP